MRMVRAVEFVRRMRGASQPSLMRCEDGEHYVVKFQNNPQHVRVLANEMLAGQLAKRIGLPVPECAVVEVALELIERSDLHFEVGSSRVCCLPGRHFGSRFPGAPRGTVVVDFLPDRFLRRTTNLSAAFLGGFVFDKWTCNCDGRQLVFFRTLEQEGFRYSALLVDHGFCFNDGEWNFPDSSTRSIYPRRLVYESVRGFDSFEPFLSRIENLNTSELNACVGEIPAEWCGESAGQLDWLAEKLYQRRMRVRQAIIEAKNSPARPFPHWA